MVNYTRLAQLSERLVKNNGRSITFVKLNETPADSNRPWKGSVSGGESTLVLNGVFVPPNSIRQFGLPSLGEGTQFQDLVTFSEQVIITFPGENDLREYTSVIDNSVRWGILGIQILRPASKTLLAFIGVRR